MKKIILIIVGVIILITIVGFGIYKLYFNSNAIDIQQKDDVTKNLHNVIQQINSFDDCKKAGFPIKETNPEKCSDGKNTFVNGKNNIKISENKENNITTKKAQEQKISNKTILILDASGSMWGKINGKTKIAIARDVLEDTLQNYDKSFELGLMAYGHRRKKDCSDIELLIEPTINNVKNIIQQVNILQPLGETPIGASVQQAADYLKYKKEKATIILVSDGIETCDIDICALGKRLENEGIDFTIHVIGFGLKKESTVAMRCLAESTGGKFSLATSEDDLEKTFGEIVWVSSCGDKLPEVTLNFPDTVGTNSEFEISWTGESQPGDLISIGEIGMKNRSDKISSFAPSSFSKIKKAKIVAPNKIGDYEITYWAGCGKDLLRKPIKVIKSMVSVMFPKNVRVGERFDVNWVGPNAVGDMMLMVPVGSSSINDKLASFGVASHSKNSKYYMKAPKEIGTYEIIYITKDRNVLYRGIISITN